MGISYSYLFEADDLAYQCQIQDIENFELVESQPSHVLNVSENSEYHKVYCKGFLLDLETVKASFGGIGVAICDNNDRQVSEVQKVVSVRRSMEARHVVVELETLIEGLNAAVKLGLKRVRVYCDNVSVYRYLTGEVRPTKKTIITLVDKFNLIRRTFNACGLCLVWPSDIKFANELARDAVIFQTTNFEEDTTNFEEDIFGKTLVEECTICYDEIKRDQMFFVNQCRHRYCLTCMRKHIEAELLQGKLPGCPHENCKSELQFESCKKFLTRNLYNIMSTRVKEAAIPETERVYCPFPDCSMLMSKTEVLYYSSKLCVTFRDKDVRKCVRCRRKFCINCRESHEGMSCSDYVILQGDAKLKSLAAQNHWRQCGMCKNMVELDEGCYHIYCRCGNEFCYTCGAAYIRKKKAFRRKKACKCPLWEEGNIFLHVRRQQNRRRQN